MSTTIRTDSDGASTAVSDESPTTKAPISADIPGADPSTFVEVMLAHPLGEKDRLYLGIPADASTEVGQRLRLTKNGARTLINAGMVTVDPEDNVAVREALTPKSSGEKPADEAPAAVEGNVAPQAEGQANPLDAPPLAPSTPVADEAPQEGVQAPEEVAPGVEQQSGDSTPSEPEIRSSGSDKRRR